MTLSPTARGLVAASCAGVLLLAGCSGGDDKGGGDGGGSKADEWQPGPLDEYTAKIYGYDLSTDEESQKKMQAENDRQMREVEELVAACMQDQGFEYTPVDNTSTMFSQDDELDVELGSKEFAEKYGYGMSTDPWGYADDVPQTDDMPEDPNADYVAAMSESEKTAYQEALYGPPQEGTGDEEVVEYDWTKGGCYGSAQHEVYEAPTASDQFAGLEEELNKLYETIQADPQTAKLNAAWASCMADNGYDGYALPTDIQNALSDEWNDLQGWDDPEYQALSESWDWDAKPEGPPAPEVDAAKSKAFTAKEIEIAVADWKCQDSTDYIKKSNDISNAAQQDFVDAHKAELDAWVEAATAARGK